jgi:hypothetical protein
MMKSARIAGILILLYAACFSGCASMFNSIDYVTVLQQAQPYSGQVRIRLGNGTARPGALFEMRVVKNEFGGLPQGEFMNQIKSEGAKHGANVMEFFCGAPGTTGERVCIVYGYRE